MNQLNKILVCMGLALLVACSAVKIPVTQQYQLSDYSKKNWARSSSSATIWITAPEAVAGYQTEQMVYTTKPFQLESFTKNAWTNAPAEMIFPLMVQSLQKSNFFHAVMSSTYSLGSDYRLDTQILSLEQSFLQKPSVLNFAAKISLTKVKNNTVIGSRIIEEHIPCQGNNPYAGVIAANKAMVNFTAKTTEFVIKKIRKNRVRD